MSDLGCGSDMLVKEGKWERYGDEGEAERTWADCDIIYLGINLLSTSSWKRE